MTAYRILLGAVLLAVAACGDGSTNTDGGADATPAADVAPDTGAADSGGDGATCLPSGAQTPDCTSASNDLCCSHRVGASGATPGVCHCG